MSAVEANVQSTQYVDFWNDILLRRAPSNSSASIIPRASDLTQLLAPEAGYISSTRTDTVL